MPVLLLRKTQAASDSDWTERSTAPNVVSFDSFESLTAGANLDNPNTHSIVVDTSIKPTGMTGSAKFPVPNSKTDSNGNVFLDFDRTFIAGDTFFVQFRTYLPAVFAYQMYPTGVGRRGFKQCIIARTDGSFNAEEVTIQSQSDGLVFGYINNGGIIIWGDGGTYHQNAIDNGANPLSGTDPDDGSAWSSNQQLSAQFGTMSALDTAADGWAPGLGQPTGGGYRWPVDEWGTYTCRVVKGEYGTENTRITWSVSSESNPEPVVVSDEVVTLEDEGGQNRLWLTCFFTDRDAGGKHVSARTGAIPGVTIRTVGLGCTNGDWTLAYTASNKRFTLTPPSGGSVGSARGVSATKRFVNVFDSNAEDDYDAGRYLGLEVDFSSLPAGDDSETITIASNRDDTEMYVSQAICSLEQIKHPGGYAVPYSSLAEAAADLGEGEWGTFSMSGMNSTLITVGGGVNNILEFCRRGYWDPINRRIVFDGKSHETGGGNSRSRTIFMDEEGAWTSLTPGMNEDNVSPAGGHTGCDFTLDQATGTGYARRYGVDRTTMILVDGAGSWTTTGFADIPGGQPIQDQTALEWHPDLFSGAGGLVNGNEGQISLWRKDTDTWSAAPSGPSYPNIMGSYNNVSVFCRRNRCVYMGGGTDGSSTNKLWRIGANGTPVARANLPHSVSVSGNAGYMFPSVGDNWPLLVDTSGDVREYNDDTNSYSSVIDSFTGGLLSAITGNEGWFVVPIDEYGILFFVYLTGGSTPSTTAHIWKPPRSS